MKRVTLIAAVTAVIGVWPAASHAASFDGVVVAKQRGVLLVASPAGSVRTVRGSAAVGSRVSVSGSRMSLVGRSHTARIRGVVVRRIGATEFVSSNRHLVAVNGTTGTSQPGDVVSSQVTIENGNLVEDVGEDLGHMNASVLTVQALVSAVGPGTVTVTVGTQALVLTLPVGLTLPASLVGQTVTLSVPLDDRNNADDEHDDHDGGHSGHGDGGSDG
jgi:hypothetical protein